MWMVSPSDMVARMALVSFSPLKNTLCVMGASKAVTAECLSLPMVSPRQAEMS